jgi:hypothetical protein
LIAKHFGLGRALASFCNQRLLGSHFMPGLLACVKWYWKGDRPEWRKWPELGWPAFTEEGMREPVYRQNRAKFELGCSQRDRLRGIEFQNQANQKDPL